MANFGGVFVKMRLFILTALIFFVNSCATKKLPKNPLHGAKPIASFDAITLKSMADKFGINGLKPFGYDAYKVSYNTYDLKDNRIKVSGVVTLPTLNGADKNTIDRLNKIKSKGLSIVLVCHSTIFSNKKAPSVRAKESKYPTIVSSVYSGGGGFITAIPDYIGFGDSKDKLHPYLIKKPSVNAVIDMLKATIKFAKQNSIKLSGDIYISGYSQGGYVALASLKALEDRGYKVRIAMPMAGSYLLDYTGKALLSQESYLSPSYSADLLYSYAIYYSIKEDKLINSKYSKNLKELFSGKYDKKYIDNRLTNNLHGDNGLLSSWLEKNYEGSKFQKKLIENSAIYDNSNFRAKIEFARCKADKTVPFVIAQKAVSILKSNGVDAEITFVEGKLDIKEQLNHSECYLPAFIHSLNVLANDRDEKLGIDE